VRNQFAGVRRNTMQITAFALVGLLLALIGVYGVLSFDVSSRSREIGIRGALGASRGTIARSVLFGASRLTLIGVAIGVPAAIITTKLIRGLLYGTSPTDPASLIVVAFIVFVAGLLASYVPARRAAGVDPVVALRSD
jgi:putative ABC transport system permease protein